MFARLSILVLLLLSVVSVASAGVSVSSPSSGSTVGSPVHFVAQATPASSSTPITSMRIYVDNASVYVAAAKSIDTNVTIANGSHTVTVQAWDSAGHVYKSAMSITVKTTSVIPPTATVFSKVEEM